MSTKTTRRPRLGAVAGILALAVATSGGAYAAGALITSSHQIKNGVVNSGDIKNGTVRVKDLHQKTVKALEPKAEKWHVVGSAGQPGFLSSWSAFPDYYSPAFRVDPDGVVHLRGAATYGSNNAGSSDIFTLPAAYRPAACVNFDVATFNGLGTQDPEGSVEVCPDGDVRMYAGGDDRFVSLEGIAFHLS
jgi:hypothetical protein